MDKVSFKIGGMNCEKCAERIGMLLAKEPGVRDARVSFAGEVAEVRYNPHRVGEERLRAVIETAGFQVIERVE